MKKRPMLCVISVFLFYAWVDLGFTADLNDSSDCECNSGTVEIGDSQYDVLKKCGDPTYLEDQKTVWVYDFGSARFIYYITFEEGTVQRIQYGGYGHDKGE